MREVLLYVHVDRVWSVKWRFRQVQQSSLHVHMRGWHLMCGCCDLYGMCVCMSISYVIVSWWSLYELYIVCVTKVHVLYMCEWATIAIYLSLKSWKVKGPGIVVSLWPVPKPHQHLLWSIFLMSSSFTSFIQNQPHVFTNCQHVYLCGSSAVHKSLCTICLQAPADCLSASNPLKLFVV